MNTTTQTPALQSTTTRSTQPLWRRVAAAAGIAALLVFGGGRAALAEANGSVETTTHVLASTAHSMNTWQVVLPETVEVASQRVRTA